MNWLIQKWYNKNYFCYLLIPLSIIYGLAIFFRRALFILKIKKINRFAVPVVVVGNITVGGTGKTPLVIWLAKFLQMQGFRPAIVSRGYGGSATAYPQWVNADSDPRIVSDEAVLLSKKTACAVVIDPNRPRAINTLLEKKVCDIVISDDGLQHYAMNRDIEIAVLDGQRRLGNGFYLPAGPLRESRKRLKQVDFVVCNGAANAGEYAMQLLPQPIYNLAQPELYLNPKNITQPIHAVAAIGNPQRFFSLLRQLGFVVIEHAFADHYLFRESDFQFGEKEIIILTEKDSVKCLKFADKRFWCLPISVELDKDFAQVLSLRLKKLA